MTNLLKITLLIGAVFILNTEAFAKKSPDLEIFPYDKNIQPSFMKQNQRVSGYTDHSNQHRFQTQSRASQSNQRVVFQAPNLNLSYQDFLSHADRAVNALMKNNAGRFVSMVSPNMLQYFGPEKLEMNVVSTLVPYFQDFKQFDTNMTIAPTRDAWGNEGYSFYQSFLTRGGDKKRFVLQMVIEDGQIVVANLTPDVGSPYQ